MGVSPVGAAPLYGVSAKGAFSMLAWGVAPGIRVTPNPQRWKRDSPEPICMGPTVNRCAELRFQRWSFIRSKYLRRCPRLRMTPCLWR